MATKPGGSSSLAASGASGHSRPQSSSDCLRWVSAGSRRFRTHLSLVLVTIAVQRFKLRASTLRGLIIRRCRRKHSGNQQQRQRFHGNTSFSLSGETPCFPGFPSNLPHTGDTFFEASRLRCTVVTTFQIRTVAAHCLPPILRQVSIQVGVGLRRTRDYAFEIIIALLQRCVAKCLSEQGRATRVFQCHGHEYLKG
jgi:hypothetical protein